MKDAVDARTSALKQLAKADRIINVYSPINNFAMIYSSYIGCAKLVKDSLIIHNREIFSGKNLIIIQTIMKNKGPAFFARKVLNNIGTWVSKEGYADHIWDFLCFRKESIISKELLSDFSNYFESDISTRTLTTERRKLRTLRLYRNYNRLCHEMNNMRLFPLPLEKYDKFVEEMYKRKGSPKFGKKKITGVVFDAPETKHERGFRGYLGRLKYRFVGVRIHPYNKKVTHEGAKIVLYIRA